MKNVIYVILFSLCPIFLFGQSLSGTITDDSDIPLVGATVMIQGLNSGTTTDINGKYSIENLTAKTYSIEVSYVGYSTFTASVNVDGDTVFDIEMSAGVVIGDGLVISATKRPQKITESIATIQTISAQQIDEYAGNPAELLARQKGIDYFRAGIAGPAFNVRGFNSNFNSKNLQITDGRFSTLIATGLPFGALDPVIKEDIERVEVILGPNSTLYGPNAHNGLLNTITKDPRKYQGTTIALNPGVSGDGDVYYSVRGRHANAVSSKFAYKVAADYTKATEFEYDDFVYLDSDGDGVTEPNPELELDRDVNFIKMNAELIYSPTEDWDINFATGHSNSTFLSPTNVGRNQIKDWRINYYQLKANNDNWYVSLNYATSRTDSTYSIDERTKQYHRLLGAGLSDADARGAASYASGALFVDDSKRLNGEVQYNNQFGNLELITGFQHQRDMADSKGTYLLDNNGEGININQSGGYLHLKYNFDNGFRIVGAARLDNHEVYGTNFIPKFGLLKVNDLSSWRLTFGQGIASPTILNLYGNLFSGLILGNSDGFTLTDGSKVPNQSVEKLTTIELGYRGRDSKSRLFIDANAYYNINKDFLSPVTVVGVATHRGDTPIDQVQSGFGFWNGLVATYVNFGQVNTYGFDFGANYYFNDKVSMNFNYSYFDYSVDKDNTENDFNKDGVVNFLDILVNAPTHKMGLGLNYRNGSFYGSIFGRWVDSYDYFSSFQIASQTHDGLTYRGFPIVENARSADTFNSGPLGGFATFDLNVGYKVTEQFSIGLSATNLFNQELREFTASAPTKGLYTLLFKYHFPN